ncbi:MAG: hypothetical protein NTU58_01100 [Candidatus Nealsonbacteria bacterium]|nr:hypothetical protein [Candidatus Nealsonbacteria bacterium]
MKKISKLAILSFIFSTFVFLIPFIDRYIPYPFPRETVYSLLDYGGNFAALILGVIALIYVKKKELKGQWFAILSIILAAIASLYV